MNDNIHNFKYKYNVFGLVIDSDIEIPELLIGKGEVDIRIVVGSVPSKIDSVVEATEGYQISKTEFLFFIEDVANFLIKDGNLIVVEPKVNADEKTVKVYLMGTAMGMLLLQRGMIPIHGSSVVVDDRCIIFTGECGAGKSTICSAFRKNGYEFLSDDISVITIDGKGIPMVQPSFPQQRLCSDTAKIMGYDTNLLSLACKADDKFVVTNSNDFRFEPMPLEAIFEIIPKDNCDIEVNKSLGVNKFQSLMKNIYCIVLFIRLGLNPTFFKQCLNISKKISYYKLFRPIGKNTVEEQVELVKDTLKQR